MDIAIVSYRRFSEMPRDVFNHVRQMGHTENCSWKRGHLRDLCNRKRFWDNNRLKYTLRSALVMYVGDTIVGWAAMYHEPMYTKPMAGAWIKTKHRKKGYGAQLIAEMYKRWRKYNPTTFNQVELYFLNTDYANKS